MTQRCVVAGRVFIVMAAVLLAVMPWTEYFWNFDNFLRGGEDFELGLFAMISIFCLLVVLLQRRKQDVTVVLILDRWLSMTYRNLRGAVVIGLAMSDSIVEHYCLPDDTLHRAYTAPLRV